MPRRCLKSRIGWDFTFLQGKKGGMLTMPAHYIHQISWVSIDEVLWEEWILGIAAVLDRAVCRQGTQGNREYVENTAKDCI
jgi:hypothetical protein